MADAIGGRLKTNGGGAAASGDNEVQTHVAGQ